jgi:hypothetical protein
LLGLQLPSLINPGSAVPFSQNIPGPGSLGIFRDVGSPDDTFVLANAGKYSVLFQVPVSLGGQLVIGLDAVNGTTELPYTVVGLTATVPTQIVGMSMVVTLVANSKLTIRVPSASVLPLSIPTGLLSPSTASLNIVRLS